MSSDARPLEIKQQALVGHELVDALTTLPRWRCFMEHHVFCVWDFMSLLKRLQRDHTCVELPWRPSSRPDLARFVNEMVLEEESDQDEAGHATSHLSLYLRAMHEAGADCTNIERALQNVRDGESWQTAIQNSRLPPLVVNFVTQTFSTATEGAPHEVAAAFFYGREQVLPLIFERLVAQSRRHPELKTLTYYFQRHIELDGGCHSKLAKMLLEATVDGDARRRKEAEIAAERSLLARSLLWGNLVEKIQHITLGYPRDSSEER